MPFTFTTTHKNTINSLLTQARAGTKAYGDIYDYMASIAKGQSGVDVASIAWLEGAADVNRGQGIASDFIREYTNQQKQIRLGQSVDAPQMQSISNAIAERVIADALSSAINGIPDIASIGSRDANEVAAGFFNGDKAAWSGNILFLALGYDFAFYSNIVPVASTDTYNLLASALAAQNANAQGSFLDTMSVVGQAFMTASGIPHASTITTQAALAADAMLQNVYGSGVITLSSTNSVFNSGQIILDQLGKNNDTVGGAGDDYIHAADGDDTIRGSAGADIIDGGDGKDKLDYSGISGGKHLQLFDVRVTADLPSGAPVIVNVEHVVGGSGNDTIIGSEKDNTIEGGGGDDILKGGGEESRLFGGEGKDIFSLSNMSFIMDGETSDRSFWGGYLISGGVQQWWQEGGYAYYSAAAPLVNVGIGSQILLGALTLFDAPFMTSTRFVMSTSGQLLIQKGRHHTAFVQEYDYEDATAGITVFRQALTTDGTIADLTRYMKLALKASGMISPDADPLIIDMNGDGITLSRVGSATSVYIDANNDGFAENRGWVRAPANDNVFFTPSYQRI
jgi:hypothetical protein